MLQCCLCLNAIMSLRRRACFSLNLLRGAFFFPALKFCCFFLIQLYIVFFRLNKEPPGTFRVNLRISKGLPEPQWLPLRATVRWESLEGASASIIILIKSSSSLKMCCWHQFDHGCHSLRILNLGEEGVLLFFFLVTQ